jgi:hypothetical protein
MICLKKENGHAELSQSMRDLEEAFFARLLVDLNYLKFLSDVNKPLLVELGNYLTEHFEYTSKYEYRPYTMNKVLGWEYGLTGLLLQINVLIDLRIDMALRPVLHYVRCTKIPPFEEMEPFVNKYGYLYSSLSKEIKAQLFVIGLEALEVSPFFSFHFFFFFIE